MAQEPPEQAESAENRRWVVRGADDVRVEGAVERTEGLNIDELPAALGYLETPELRNLRVGWTQAIAEGAENVREHAIAYQEKAEAADAEHRANFRRGLALVLEWMTGAGEMGLAKNSESIVADAASLGFTETAAMRTLRARITVAVAQSLNEGPDAALNEYIDDYQRLAKDREGVDGAKFQIGLLIAKAIVQRDGGEMGFYHDDLGDAQDYAIGMGFEDVVTDIDRELNPPGS